MNHRIAPLLAAAMVLAAVFLPQRTAYGESCDHLTLDDKKITLKGTAEILDGDTLWLGIHKIRLYGIEALEHKQPCLKDGKRFRCFEKARDIISDWVKDRQVRCVVDRGNFGRPVMDRNRYLATCYIDHHDLNRKIVAAGWALAYEGETGDVYRADEAAAKQNRLGIHQATFSKPSEFRRSNKDKYQCSKYEAVCTPKKARRPDIMTPAPGK